MKLQLQKNIAIVFTCYYLMICVGLTLTVHFCSGMLAGVSAITKTEVVEVAPEACCVAKAKTNKDCCNDAIIDLSEVKEDSLASVFDVFDGVVAILPKHPIVVFKPLVFTNKIALPNYTFQSNAPPLYKLYSTYIYYA